MAADWIECHLGDVVTLKRGYDLSTALRNAGGVPVVSSSGISGHHDEAKVRGPGVVTGRYGTLGEVFYIRGDFWPLNTTLYVQDFKGNDPLFVSYFLRTLNFASQNVAGAVPGVNRNYLHMLQVRVPPLPTQRKIADILSAYDDLIENNTRRIQILEEMAQTIYHEWFVNFRFPGHEQVEMVEMEAGIVPEGWDVTTIGAAFEILGGGTPSKTVLEYWEGGDVTWFTPSDLTRSGTMFIERSGSQITQQGLRHSSARLFPAYSVMMTSRATIGVLSINTTPACTNQGFIICLPNTHVSAYYLYYWLKEQEDKISSHASGATFKEISKGVFRTFEFLMPPQNLMILFTDTIEPLARQILNLQRKNTNLRRTRDLLLPKLVSGEVDVDG